jgi:uncharacterized protein YodC (DUF2158 family)
MNTFKNFFIDKIDLLFGASPEFKKGDTVQLISGGYLMVILDVKRNLKKSPSSILCEWYDRDQKLTLKNTFLAIEIKMFDWYHPA